MHVVVHPINVSNTDKRAQFNYTILPDVHRSFKIASVNSHSLLAHIDELRILLSDNPIDILAINETKLDSSVKDNQVRVKGYKIKRRDRLSDGGGGVCFYVKAGLKCSVRNDLKIDNLENLCIELRSSITKPFYIVTWYRPPNSLVETFTYFEQLVGKLDALDAEY